MILRSSLQCESTFKMDLATWMLMTFILFTALAECLSEKGTINVAVGQDVRIPCGIQVQGSFERLVWKSDANSTDHFAFLYGGSSNCNTKKKANCDLSSDGSLELYNVEKTDSGDYFCVVGTDEKYYSQHTLVVHPEVAFETCPNPEDVFVTQTGPDEMVFAYTNPVCKNTDVIGTVTCDPPSGAKIGMNVSKIVCTCSHSGNEVDTCPIPIPAVGIVSAPVTVLGIFIGIIIGAVLGVTIDRLIIIIAYFSKNKGNCKGTTDEEDRPETTELMNTTANSETRESNVPASREQTQEPEFTTHFQPNMTYIQGDPLELKCSVNGYPIPTIVWFKDDKQLDPQAGYKTTFSDGIAMLTAENTKEADKGRFCCMAFNPEGQAMTSCNVVVEKRTKPMFTTRLQPNMIAIHGKSLELKCSVKGYPDPTFLWYKDGKQLDPHAGYKTTYSEGIAKMTAESTKEYVKGTFSCKAVNPEGEDTTSCYVVVEKHTKPEFTRLLQPNLTIIQGEPLELKCTVKGYPTPTILWFKDEKTLDSQAGYKITFSEGEAKLTAESTREGAEGRFCCLAVNPEGQAVTSCYIEKSTVVVPVSDDNGTLEGHSDKTDSGKPFTNPNESAVDISDGNTNIDTPNIPSSTELIEVRVDHSSARFEVLPSRTNPADGLVIFCMFDENLTVGFLGQDITTTRKGNRLILNEATVPLHIKCLKCGKYCCSLKMCGGEWSEDVKKHTSKDSCEKEDSNEADRVARNLNSHTGNTYSLKSGRPSH